MANVTGAFVVTINGDPYPVTDGEFDPGGDTSEPVRAGRQIIGQRKTFRGPRFTGKVAHQAGTSIFAIKDFQDAEVQIETDTGSVWQMFGAHANESGTLTESDGMIGLELLGSLAIEVSA